MLPRPVRAVVIGFPNVGKSALINRLLGKRVVASEARPGVTRQLRWVRISEQLELLDAPGVIPLRLEDQDAALKLAICDDIGEASYDNQLVAAALVDLFNYLEAVTTDLLPRKPLQSRYQLDSTSDTGDTYLHALAEHLFSRRSPSRGTSSQACARPCCRAFRPAADADGTTSARPRGDADGCVDDNFDIAGGAGDDQPLGIARRQMRSLSTISPPTRCRSMISSMSCRSTYVYQTSSGYTTITGPSSQRSRQPALLMRTRSLPESPSALIRFFAYCCSASASLFAQQRSGGSRWLQQKNTWCW